MLTGTQSLLPALPAMQEVLDLSEAQIGLFTGAYFLPSIVLALPAGILADRLGRRTVFGGGLLLFGLCGLVMTIWHSSFAFLLAIRSIQGAAFAAVLPLTMTLIADARAGGDQVKGQSHRSVAMKAGETLGPAAGGVLVLISWFAPMALQILAVPVALLSWRQVPTGRTMGKPIGEAMGVLLGEFRKLKFVLLQSVGFFRFFFKFGFLTFMPLLAVNEGILTVVETGVVLTLSAAAALVTAAIMTRITIRRPPSLLIGFNLAIVGVSLIGVGMSTSAWMLTLASIGFGIADSAASIIYSAVITEAVEDDMRATFVAANGAIRNLGKFAAPIALGALLLIVSIPTGFVLLGTSAVLYGLVTPSLRSFDRFGPQAKASS